jgi:hypothetical protein
MTSWVSLLLWDFLILRSDKLDDLLLWYHCYGTSPPVEITKLNDITKLYIIDKFDN